MNEWNRKAAAITGYSTAEMLGRVLVDAEVIKTEFRTSFAEVLTLAMQGISTDNFELPLYARDGSRVELLLNATTRKDARGEVVGVVMVGQDVTGKKDIEKAQITAAKVRWDPAETPHTHSTRARLPLLPLQARAASDAKGKFMASMSHEMRTPLNGVLGMLQLAMELELPPQAVKYS